MSWYINIIGDSNDSWNRDIYKWRNSSWHSPKRLARLDSAKQWSDSTQKKDGLISIKVFYQNVLGIPIPQDVFDKYKGEEPIEETPFTYKVGDWVKILPNYSGSAHKAGDVVLVHSLNASGEVRSVEINALHGPGNGWISNSQLRIATDSEISNAKKLLVGRYVKCKINSPNGGSARQGDIGVIESVISGDGYVKGFSQSSYSIDFDFSTKYELLPVSYGPKSKSPEIMKETFEVGDYAVITKSSHNWGDGMNKFVGKTVQITSVSDFGDSINFINSAGYYWSFKQGHFREATDFEKSSLIAKTSDISPLKHDRFSEFLPYRLKPGDLHFETGDDSLYSELAKRKYPDGTKFECASSGGLMKIDTSLSGTYRILQGSGNIDGGYGQGYLFENGKWAIIVDLPKGHELIEKFPDGQMDESLGLSLSIRTTKKLNSAAIKTIPTISVKIK